MARINDQYLKLQASYLFSEIGKKVRCYTEANPHQRVIRMGIGDVTEPLPRVCREAFQTAIEEMGTREGFRGYGPEQGYEFLREAIAGGAYQSRGCDIKPSEIFVSDGSKCDSGNIQEIFSQHAKVAVPDPVYPVYVDTNVMAGRTGFLVNGRYDGLIYMEATAANDYLPELPRQNPDLIYLCFPNNPTGAVASKEMLEKWVEFALSHKAVILYDAAYEAFIEEPGIPRSIFEIPGARECAIEFRSFSKNAGFTGIRCAYTVVPEELVGVDGGGEPVSIHKLWNRRHTTKFNGVSYPVQKAAAAVFSEAGQKETGELIRFYMKNAALIVETVESLGFTAVGGRNAPYVWIPVEGSSWEMFDRLLSKAGVVCTPGAGFGQCGEGHIRLSAFNSHENVVEAMERIRSIF